MIDVLNHDDCCELMQQQDILSCMHTHTLELCTQADPPNSNYY